MNISRKLEVKIYLIIIGFFLSRYIDAWFLGFFYIPILDYWGILLGFLALVVFIFRTGYLILEKAGHNGWLVLIPIYNIIIFFKIVNRPLWWLVFLIIPIANLVIHIIVQIDLAKSFRKDVGFGLGLAFLSPIFYPILAFGDAEYSFPDRESGNSGNQSDDSSEELSKYKKMLDDGLITQEQYDAKSNELLGL